MSFIKHAIVTLFLFAVIGIAVSSWIVMGGRFDVAASAQHPQPIHDLIHQTRVNAVSRQVRDLEAPPVDLTDDAILFEAIVGFQSMCADCHHPPGGQPSALARGLNPPPANLSESARKRSVEELFWVTKHGIRMSGMPAWGPSHSDAELWPIAVLITHFPDFAESEFEQLLKAAREAGVEHHHHDDDDDHDH